MADVVAYEIRTATDAPGTESLPDDDKLSRAASDFCCRFNEIDPASDNVSVVVFAIPCSSMRGRCEPTRRSRLHLSSAHIVDGDIRFQHFAAHDRRRKFDR